MGAVGNGYRKETRDGNVRWIIDFRFRDKRGRPERYRRDARVQTAAGARAEAERLMRYAAEHGTLVADARRVLGTKILRARPAALSSGDRRALQAALRGRPAGRSRERTPRCDRGT
jgi:hypothetical protein